MITPDQIQTLKPILYDLIPANGSAIGNTFLRRSFLDKVKKDVTLQDDDYWTIRNELLAEGKVKKGAGMGGSVRRIQDLPKPVTAPAKTSKYKAENDLYKPYFSTIQNSWVKDYGIEDYIGQITANQGSRNTGGRWTRPDITIAAVRIYPFIPGKSIEVITFEVKPLGQYGIEGVFETASHSAFAHKSYLALHVSDNADDELMGRITRECERFGVGLVTFEDPENWDSFNVLIEAEYKSPDPAELCGFLASQITHHGCPVISS